MSQFKPRLLTPGPVEVPPAVLEALARPVLHHRTAEFRELFANARSRLAEVFGVPGGEVLVVTGSGTAAFEAVLATVLARPSAVLSLLSGKFSERWGEMAASLGHDVSTVVASNGAEFDLGAVAAELVRRPDLAAVTVVHSETSTGALNDVRAVAELVRRERPDALVIVDAVTSLAAAELDPVGWDVDAVVSGSQKGVMCPPGLGFAWLSERAWERASVVAGPTGAYYLDLRREREKQRQGETAYTPAVPLVAALDAALRLILDEGLGRVIARRRSLNDALLAAGAALCLAQYAATPSPAVAALVVPDGVSAPAIVKAARVRGATLAGGQGEMKPFLLRPSLLGWADKYDAVAAAQLLEDAVRDVDPSVPHGVAVPAALRLL